MTMNRTLAEELPALTPPSGTDPDFVNPYTLQPFVLASVVISLFLTSWAIMARVFVKMYITRSMKLEDCEYMHHVIKSSPWDKSNDVL